MGKFWWKTSILLIIECQLQHLSRHINFNYHLCLLVNLLRVGEDVVSCLGILFVKQGPYRITFECVPL